MRKKLLTTCMAVSLLCTTSAMAASPDGFFFKPYIGASYDYFSVNYQNVPATPYSYGDFFADSFNGGDIHIGARIHKYLGLEGSYFDTASESKGNIIGTSANSSAKIDGWTLDAMGYLPIGESQKLELIATGGLARTSASGSVTVSGTPYSANATETKIRLGGGAQYWLTDNLNVRGVVRYQDASFSGVANNVVISSLGLNWQF